MGRPKKSAPQHVEPEDISQEAPEQEAWKQRRPMRTKRRSPPRNAGASPLRGKPSARPRRSGRPSPQDTTRPRTACRTSKTFGIEIARPHFSATKSQMKKKAQDVAAVSPGRDTEGRESVRRGLCRTPPNLPDDGGMDLLDAMEAMKPLIASLARRRSRGSSICWGNWRESAGMPSRHRLHAPRIIDARLVHDPIHRIARHPLLVVWPEQPSQSHHVLVHRVKPLVVPLQQGSPASGHAPAGRRRSARP